MTNWTCPLFSLPLQMKDYSKSFSGGVRYYTNNRQMQAHLQDLAGRMNLNNVTVHFLEQ